MHPFNPALFNPDGSMTCTAGQVAQLLGWSEPTFDKRRPELAANGFPPKLPGVNKWSRPAVVRWISNNGAAGDPLTITIDPADLGEETALLEHRYAGAAQ